MERRADAIQTICAAYDNLSATDQRIASYILNHRSTIPETAMREIAIACGTSSPTVSRFIKRIGYDDFNDLRVNLARSEGERAQSESVIGRSTGQISLERFHESLNFILSCKTAELADTVAQVDQDSFKSVVSLLKSARDILVVGVGNTRTLADNMAFKLRHLGLRGYSPATADDAIAHTSTLDNSDMIVVISSSGISRRLSRLVGIAADLKIPLVLITSNDKSPLIPQATHLLMSTQRDRLFAYGVPFSHNSINFLIEVLFLFLHASSEEIRRHVELFSSGQDDLDRGIDPKTGEFIKL